jgi:hypothetical protein
LRAVHAMGGYRIELTRQLTRCKVTHQLAGALRRPQSRRSRKVMTWTHTDSNSPRRTSRC